MNRMFELHVRHLVVQEDGGLIGLIGVRDVLAALLKEEQGRTQVEVGQAPCV
jgi:signal-transduction protein with cAMP-binding, CBS, and nucleotidyltransferase domain